MGGLNRLLELGKINVLSIGLARMRLKPLQNRRHHTGGEIIGNAPQSRIELREEIPDVDIDDILFSKDEIVILKKYLLAFSFSQFDTPDEGDQEGGPESFFSKNNGIGTHLGNHTLKNGIRLGRIAHHIIGRLLDQGPHQGSSQDLLNLKSRGLILEGQNGKGPDVGSHPVLSSHLVTTSQLDRQNHE